MPKNITKKEKWVRSMPTKRHKGEKVIEHVTKIGEIVWASNKLQAAFYMFFAALMPKNEIKLSSLIWNAVVSDKAQRDVLMAVAKKCLNSSDYLDLEWMCEQARCLAAYRNSYVHSPMERHLNNGDISPHSRAVDKKHADRIVKYRADDLRGDLLQLEQYALERYTVLFCNTPPSSRERPVSRLLQQQKKEDGHIQRRTEKLKLIRQHKPSPQ